MNNNLWPTAATLDDLRRREQETNKTYQEQLDDLKDRCAEKQEQVDAERINLMEFKKTVAMSAVNSQTGKPIQPKVSSERVRPVIWNPTCDKSVEFKNLQICFSSWRHLKYKNVVICPPEGTLFTST